MILRDGVAEHRWEGGGGVRNSSHGLMNSPQSKERECETAAYGGWSRAQWLQPTSAIARSWPLRSLAISSARLARPPDGHDCLRRRTRMPHTLLTSALARHRHVVDPARFAPSRH